jgi:hypothetical protein
MESSYIHPAVATGGGRQRASPKREIVLAAPVPLPTLRLSSIHFHQQGGGERPLLTESRLIAYAFLL